MPASGNDPADEQQREDGEEDEHDDPNGRHGAEYGDLALTGVAEAPGAAGPAPRNRPENDEGPPVRTTLSY
jgi:hypothetical protein